MAETPEILHTAFVIKKAYDSVWDDISEKFSLTRAEIDVLAFIANNPLLNTASNVVDYRMIAKSHVSKAVEHLMERGYVVGNKDQKDRRQVHLALTETADEVVREITKRQHEFKKMMCDGITEEEFRMFKKVAEKIVKNSGLLINDKT